MTQPVIFAVDLGTGGAKVALVTKTGTVLGSEFEPTPLLLLPGGGAEQRPEDWWNAIRTASQRLMARSLATVGDVRGVCCCAQWSGTVAVGEDGSPLMNAIIWMDSRGARYVRQIAAGPITIEGYGVGRLHRWVSVTGGAPARSGKDPLAHILWLKHERPEVYARAQTFLEPKDYLNLRLTGEPATSADAITLHWVTDNRDIDRVAYDAKLLRWSGIDPAKLPPLRPVGSVLGELRPEAAGELGLEPGLPVVAGTPDLPGAGIGSGALRDFEAHLYVGTSSWLTCHVPFKKTSLRHNMAALPAPIPGRYFVANEQETAGACVEHLRDKVLFPDDALRVARSPGDFFQRFDRVAGSVPAGSGKLIFLPWLYGERTPVEDHRLRGGFFNVSLHTTRAHVARAILEGVAFNSRWLLGCLEKFCRRRLDPIRFIGGGASSQLWCQIYADVLGRSIHQVADPIQANVRGAGLLGAVGVGLTSFDELAGRVEVGREHEPNRDHRAVYDELFGAFLELHRRTRGVSARLNAD